MRNRFTNRGIYTQFVNEQIRAEFILMILASHRKKASHRANQF